MVGHGQQSLVSNGRASMWWAECLRTSSSTDYTFVFFKKLQPIYMLLLTLLLKFGTLRYSPDDMWKEMTIYLLMLVNICGKSADITRKISKCTSFLSQCKFKIGTCRLDSAMADIFDQYHLFREEQLVSFRITNWSYKILAIDEVGSLRLECIYIIYMLIRPGWLQGM